MPISEAPPGAPSADRRSWLVLLIAAALFFALALPEWHPRASVRSATGLVAATLTLWISEAAPLGVTALLIPVIASSAGILPWESAVGAWGDPIVFLFLGAFLLARALDKHGAFDRIGEIALSRGMAGGGGRLALLVLLISGAVSTMQNNTAVTAMLLPVVIPLARQTRNPAIVMLALAYGATFGGMATPVGTAPNFQGFAAMKLADPHSSFVGWMIVGIPVWLGTTLIGWGVLVAAGRLFPHAATHAASRAETLIAPFVQSDVGPARPEHRAVDAGPRVRAATFSPACWVAIAAFAATAFTWLSTGAAQALLPTDSAVRAALKQYVPEALPPILAACLLFVIRARG